MANPNPSPATRFKKGLNARLMGMRSFRSGKGFRFTEENAAMYARHAVEAREAKKRGAA